MQETFDYIHELLNRQMALRAKIEASPLAGELRFYYGNDYYQEEARSIGLAMIREGMDAEGQQVILDFTKEHYRNHVDAEILWIARMMRDLLAITDTFVDNLQADGYTYLQSNVDLPNRHAIFYPIHNLDEKSLLSSEIGLYTVLDLRDVNHLEHLEGWAYYRPKK